MSKELERDIRAFHKFLEASDALEEFDIMFNDEYSVRWRRAMQRGLKHENSFYRLIPGWDWVGMAFPWDRSERGDDGWIGIADDWSDIFQAYKFRQEAPSNLWQAYYFGELDKNTTTL